MYYLVVTSEINIRPEEVLSLATTVMQIKISEGYSKLVIFSPPKSNIRVVRWD